MNILKREIAPIPQAGWSEIDERATMVLKTHLSARKVVHVKGPFGWDYSVVPEGRLSLLEDEKKDGVRSGLYNVKPLLEARVGFRLDRWELDNLVRGAHDIDLDPLDEAVKKIALFEENAVYNGYAGADIKGLFQSSEQKPVPFGKEGSQIMQALSKAVLMMQDAHQSAPFSLVVGEEAWKRVNSEVQGYPLIKRIRDIIGGQVLYSSAVKAAVLVPQDHEDLELSVGGDFSIGYEYHDAKMVQLFVSESFTFRVLDPAIVIPFTV
jgi:uncharacterized linocin/CFP29 family protein